MLGVSCMHLLHHCIMHRICRTWPGPDSGRELLLQLLYMHQRDLLTGLLIVLVCSTDQRAEDADSLMSFWQAQMAADAAAGQPVASAATMGPQEGADEAGAGPAAAGQPADGGEPASPGGSRRTRGAQPRQPPIRFSGNHIIKPLRLRHQDADQQRIRKRVRIL